MDTHQLVPNVGILTIATGDRFYLKLAIRLVQSIRVAGSSLPVSLATDLDLTRSQRRLFDQIVQVPKGLPVYESKLRLDELSPYDNTLFVDGDCLAISSPDFVFSEYADVSFMIESRGKIRDGFWYGVCVQDFCKQNGIDAIQGLNGGIYYFNRSEHAQRVFRRARDVASNYCKYGFRMLRDSIPDEPCFSMAVVELGCSEVVPMRRLMSTPMDACSININVKRQYCCFKWASRESSPVIAHFNAAYCRYYHYRRESLRVALLYYLPRLLSPVASLFCGLYTASYVLEIVFRRLWRRFIRKQSVRWTPLVPISRYC